MCAVCKVIATVLYHIFKLCNVHVHYAQGHRPRLRCCAVLAVCTLHLQPAFVSNTYCVRPELIDHHLLNLCLAGVHNFSSDR
jgi:hypothetical protein